MQYTDHYNLNLPEGTDIVNPLVQDNPNYTAIDNALYSNKLRVVGTATELTTGSVHALTRADQDIPVFRFVATSDYNSGDTFTVDGVSVTAKLANGTAIPGGAYKINSTVLAILDGTILNLVNIDSVPSASDIILSDGRSVENAINPGYVEYIANGTVNWYTIITSLYSNADVSKISNQSVISDGTRVYHLNTRSANYFEYVCEYFDIAGFISEIIALSPSGAIHKCQGVVVTDIIGNVPTAGTVIRLYY